MPKEEPIELTGMVTQVVVLVPKTAAPPEPLPATCTTQLLITTLLLTQ